MSDTPLTVEAAEAEVEHATADLAAAEKSTEEILANAPPLVLPEGVSMVKECHQCGLKLDGAATGVPCPNCGVPLP